MGSEIQLTIDGMSKFNTEGGKMGTSGIQLEREGSEEGGKKEGKQWR